MLLRGPERNRLYIALFVVPLVLARAPGLLPQPFHYTLQVWPAFAIPAFVAGGAAIVKLLTRRNNAPLSVALGVRRSRRSRASRRLPGARAPECR